MSKKVLVISSTLRKNGNSEKLAQEFMRGAKDSGNSVEFISLQDKEIKFCKGCLSCLKTGECVIKDDSIEIVKKMKDADVIVFSSPIYYYEMSGQLKTLLDRANPLYTSDYKFREIYFLTTAADSSYNASNIATSGIKGWVSCFSKAQFKRNIHAVGVEAIGDVQNNLAMEEAYKAGKGV